MNESLDHLHPDDLLGAYALDVLEEDEASIVEAHLEACPQCLESVAGFRRAASLLGFLTQQQEPPPDLQSRILDSLPSASATASGASRGLALSLPVGSMTRWVMPLAAAIVLGLFGMSLAMNLKVSSRVDQLEEANSTVTAQLGESMVQAQQLAQANSVLAARLNRIAADDQEVLGTVHQIKAASYLAAHPNTQPLLLEPPSGSGDSQGVLLVGEGGQRALLMVSNMEQPPALKSYQVWLVRSGQRVPVGQVQVDSSGWGSLTLTPPEPLFEFEWVNLTVEDQDSYVVTERMVLRSKIPSAEKAR